MLRFIALQRLILTFATFALFISTACAQQEKSGWPYLKTSNPKEVLNEPQTWEGDEQNRTLSVVELNRGGFKYWGYYGLNGGRGIGLARSNDLEHWTKYENNPLWTNARWASAITCVDKKHPGRVYLAITRNFDTPLHSHIVLASTDDGIHLNEIKTIVKEEPPPTRIHNQNPNLFHDPISGMYFLYFYRGNDKDYFDIMVKGSKSIEDLDKADEKVLLHDSETVAAPTMLYVPNGLGRDKGIYYLATEIYPHRYANPPQGEWQVKVFASDAPEGNFLPVKGNPVQAGERACLFQFVFHGRYYGYQSHLEHQKRCGSWRSSRRSCHRKTEGSILSTPNGISPGLPG
jgi:hypothetical protein